MPLAERTVEAIASHPCEGLPFAEEVATVVKNMKRIENGNVTLDEWADFASLGKHRLTAAFRTFTGLPPITFHNSEKLEIAKRLLVFENLCVTDTCYEIGFESLGSFVKKFSDHVGISPGNYARVMRETGFPVLFLSALAKNWDRRLSVGKTRRITFDCPIVGAALPLVAAVFKRPYPCGYPATWRFLRPLKRSTDLDQGVAGHLLCATTPIRPTLEQLVNFQPDFIGRGEVTASPDDVTIEMGRPTLFDPPITLAVPALFCSDRELEILEKK